MSDSAVSRATLLELASDPDRTPFDYLVVGSGAGGGPLAARLARAGKRVLLIEAGTDPALSSQSGGDPVSAQAFDKKHWRDVYQVPGYHASATEDPEMSWEFSVRHYCDDALQGGDQKYDKTHDPSANGQPGKGGIQYPRCSALGGCTAHHAMIAVRPNDRDWDTIAEMTGDDSWRADTMQGYFAKLEDCLYDQVYQDFLQKTFQFFYTGWRKLVTLINPRWTLDEQGHGTSGWQKTSFISPDLIKSIARNDPALRKVLIQIVHWLVRGRFLVSMLERIVVRLQLLQYLDPNLQKERGKSSARVVLIPTGTDGTRRTGLREWLLQTAKECPDHLVIETGVFATRLLFQHGDRGAPPRAHGVEVAPGLRLYEASLGPRQAAGKPRQYYARGEIIVCGGAFNTPQLLMLSGIGSAAELARMQIYGLQDADKNKVADVIDLPGVGCNLQDRYEISVVSEVEGEYATLRGVTLQPGNKDDPMYKQWLQGKGLYTTNGSAMAIFLDSQVPRRDNEPDLFVIGFPAAFRGYYWGWSKELLKPRKGAPKEQRNLWSWVILKAYTSNAGGVVRLRSSDPFRQPEINFHSFQEGPHGYEDDMQALVNGVTYIRQLTDSRGSRFRYELQPGSHLSDDSAALRDWIRKEAWGHHACGTCRIGRDPWRPKAEDLCDKKAVVDGHFRVHGVSGLRVVDASVFPYIPGYFLCTAVFMIAEKAADTIIADSKDYPSQLESLEAHAVMARRSSARCKVESSSGTPADDDSGEARLPPDTVGLALSGGGIRSATFCLGVLQALAEKNKLRAIDMLSTVSGGGFTGGFLGRLFTRLDKEVGDKAGRVQRVLGDTSSEEIWWLRRNANYLAAAGRPEWYLDLGILWRNLIALHLCVGALALGVFAALRLVSDSLWAAPILNDLGIVLSPWWWAPVAVLLVMVVPGSLGFWLTPKGGTSGAYPLFTLIAWIVLLGGAVAACMVTAYSPWAIAAVGVLLLAWMWQEIGRWYLPDDVENLAKSVVVRNRVTRYLGWTLLLVLLSAFWVFLDTWARTVAATGGFIPMKVGGAVAGAIAVLAPVLRLVMRWLSASKKSLEPLLPKHLLLIAVAAVIAYLLAAALFFAIDLAAHATFGAGTQVGIFVVIVALSFSFVVGRAFEVLNRSSLQSAYAERLARTFLGASNAKRTHPVQSDGSVDVQLANPDDDIPFDRYHPERNGGPLHLINVCVNETADAMSGRSLREDKGLAMCLGPVGVSVGRRHHALWQRLSRAGMYKSDTWLAKLEDPDADLARKQALKALPVASDPNAFHVLGRRDQKAAGVEALRLSQWMSISGAAFTTGLGRNTRMPLSLLFGLLNLRIGYWWDSGINAGDRPNRYPPDFWRRIRSFPGWLFKVQSMILNEWRGYFPGPSDRYWYLTDGGHFEVLGLYELIRRRLPFIIAVDATADPGYQFEDVAILTRLVRLDFGAELSWIDPARSRRPGMRGWNPIEAAAGTAVPGWIQSWLDPDALGARQEITRDGPHSAALARIVYGKSGSESWLLLLKASVPPAPPVDVRFYETQNPTFPNEPTTDQFFSDAQWESYRKLGQTIGRALFA